MDLNQLEIYVVTKQDEYYEDDSEPIYIGPSSSKALAKIAEDIVIEVNCRYLYYVAIWVNGKFDRFIDLEKV